MTLSVIEKNIVYSASADAIVRLTVFNSDPSDGSTSNTTPSEDLLIDFSTEHFAVRKHIYRYNVLSKILSAVSPVWQRSFDPNSPYKALKVEKQPDRKLMII